MGSYASASPAVSLRHYARQKTAGPVGEADRYTSMCDARTALALSIGTSIDDIDPASGYSMSRRSYEVDRHSWIASIKSHGFSAIYEQEDLNKAVAFWVERRPQYLDGDDWLAAGMAAHREYWQSIGRDCNRPSCDMHGDGIVMLQAAEEARQQIGA